ncbi:MAG TPA: PKD domain-containing protein [Candidatus Acidoferrum sp.]|jgi:uncharacterized repeat protein (TIGR03803 family)|nr:PKD domain-containing protein [Candidatus Acidoferrum sp.]
MKAFWVFLLGCLPLTSSEALAQFSYATNNGALTITDYTGPGGVVAIPSWVNGLPVTAIAGGAISGKSSTALMVTIPGGVTNIGDYAFASDYGLTRVYFEGNAPAVGSHVFFDDNLLGGSQTAYYLPGATGWGSTVGAAVPTQVLPGIAITANPTNGLEPLAVSFTAAAVDGAGHTVTNWNWDFGDGSTSTAQNPSHAYSTSGTFPVALIENGNGVPVAGTAQSITVSPLTVVFTANPTNVLESLAVSFSSAGVDNGGNTLTNWNWNFGDGSASTAQNPSHAYAARGTFSVALVATNNLGLMVGGLGPSITVTPLTLAFTANPTSGTIPLTVNFSSASTDSAGHAVTNWNWNFGDGSTSTAQNPSHTYTNSGTFSVALLATNDIGYTVLGSGSATILALPPPQAQFTFTTNNGALTIASYLGSGGPVIIPSQIYGLPVTGIQGYAFNLISSAVTVMIPASVTNIGDYAFEFDANLTAVYFEGNAPSAGPHVFYGDGTTAYYFAGTTGWGSTIGSSVPTKQLSAIAVTANPTAGSAPLAVNFTSAGGDSGGAAVTNWNWNFGDGSTSAAQNPSHTYTNSGIYSVVLVENGSNGFPAAGSILSVRVSPFSVAFTADPTIGLEPLTVNFTSAGVDNGGHTVTNWNWDFGDGSISALQNPSHTYTNSGTFSVVLLATNNLGYTVFGSGPASIQALPPPQDEFTFTTNQGTITIQSYTGASDTVLIPGSLYGLPVTAIAGDAIANLFYRTITLTIPGSVTNIGAYAFQNDYYLDGVYFEGNAPTVGAYAFLGDGQATAYYLPGTTGWSGAAFAGIPAQQLPGIAVTANPTNGPMPLAVSFTSAGIDSGGHAVANWNWDFGDGSTSTAQNPSHTFSTSGTFPVALTENSNGVPVAGAALSIAVFPFTVVFSANPTNVLESLPVSFSSASIDNGGHTLTNWNWNFGDGSSSTVQNPSHAFSASGTFSVSLTATNSLGLAVGGSGPSIVVAPLTLAFTAAPTSGLVPLTVNFTAASIDNGGHAVTNWNWNFGDGSSSTVENPSHIYSSNGVFSLALIATNNLGLRVTGLGPAALTALLPVPHYTNFNVVLTFAGTNGAFPFAGLVLSGNTLYGTTAFSVAPKDGTIFSFNDANLAFTDLLHFPNLNPPNNFENYDGANPQARVILSGSTLYGTTCNGAQSGYGNVFSFNILTSQLIALHVFSTPTNDAKTGLSFNSDGINPIAALALAGTTLYGTAQYGGSNGYGTVFSFNTANSNFTTLHTFTGANDGAYPVGDLILSGNTLYGTANAGGSHGYGAVFSLGIDGSNFTNLYGFTGGNDGAFPSQGALLLSSNRLYGTTGYGGSHGFGTNGQGTVFSLGADGSGFKSLYSFTGGNDGVAPGASLIISGQTLYGTAAGGGAAGSGTIYSLGAQGSNFTLLYSFSPTQGTNGINSDGANPTPGLVLSQNVLYGTAVGGGTNGYGTLFALPFPASATAPIPLNIQFNLSHVVLNWNGAASPFSLQSAPTAAGVFTNIPNATSPYTNFITGAQKFFRLVALPP